MKLSKKINNLPALLLVIFTFNSYSAETPESSKPEWLTYASSALLNGYSALRQFLTATRIPSTGFSNLPMEIQVTIIQLFSKSCTDKTPKEAGTTINALAQTNKQLNKLINNPEFNLELIKNRAKQFNVSDVLVAKTFQTQASKVQLKIQLVLAKIMKELIEEQENYNALARLNKLLQKFELKDNVYTVDLDFTYRWNQESQEYSSPLMHAVKHSNKFLVTYLVNKGANINQAGFNGKTPLMYADDPEIITFLTEQTNLNINQQDAGGNTALLRAIQNYFPEDEEHKDQNIAVIQTLLDDGANPTIANNNGDTPLQAAQATGDEEVIDLIQQEIDAM